MKTLKELYQDIKKKELENGRKLEEETDAYSLDCLLHPKNHAAVIAKNNCTDCNMDHDCQKSCVFDAISKIDGRLYIDPAKCAGCGACIDACKMGNLIENKEIYPLLEVLAEQKKEVYALVAPAFIGQFGEDVTEGKMRSACKSAGFSGMVEVAAFADILTLKEALEFHVNIHKKGDFQLTSCCCPVWIAMIRNVYHELIGHVPGAVSPMIAAGRVVKALHPDAFTVFIGPCMAKKKEAKEEDIADAIDVVLTFEEMNDIFEALGIDPKTETEDIREHSSMAGRIYAKAGGVSEAVKMTAEQLNLENTVEIKAERADGVKNCKELIQRILNGETDANFFEGMACVGGCVGGPKVLIEKESGREYVTQYGKAASYQTPLENPYIREVLERLGFTEIEDFVEHSRLLDRTFS
mgnify:FL=1